MSTETQPAVQPVDSFPAMPQQDHRTSEGPVGLPILYHDASALYAFFTAPAEAVAKRIADRGLEPALVFGRRAVIGMACYEYRDTTIGAYNEVGVAIPAIPAGAQSRLTSLADLLRKPRDRQLGMVVIELPVTTRLALVAGRELWGYPKFETPIAFAMDARRFACTVHAPAGRSEIMHLGGKLYPGIPLPPFSFFNYDRLEDRDLRTLIEVRGASRLRPGRGLRLELGQAAHPMTETLHELQLHRARPLAVVSTPRLRVRLHAGSPIEN